MKRRIIFTIIVILIFLIGLSVMLYPIVSDYLNSQRQSRVVAQYFTDLLDIEPEDFEHLIEEAREYNKRLTHNADRFNFTPAQEQEYFNMLNPFGNGMMGVLTIDKINVNLPLYHGTTEEVLQIGVGHFEGTSMPIGGIGTHSVISGHRGLPSSTLLTDLDQLVIGDIFVLNVVGEILTYQVDRIIVVEPHDLQALAIDLEKDYSTLVTCTPYGINSHRMLVRGFRVPNAPEAENQTPGSSVTGTQTNGEKIDVKLVAALILAPVLLITIVVLIIKLKRIYS